jgi:epoxyqueuosine reductase QueG
MKPLILLYPETKQEVSVELEYTPGFSATFPRYDNAKKGWSVTASPDGTLLDHTTQQETY